MSVLENTKAPQRGGPVVSADSEVAERGGGLGVERER